MTDDSDPRVFFAAERTLLAWLRTGLTIVGLGFVVSRFGLFLKLIRPADAPAPSPGSIWIGAALVALGGAAILGATWQHTRFVRQLPRVDRPAGYWSRFAVLVSTAVGLSALALTGYLLMT